MTSVVYPNYKTYLPNLKKDHVVKIMEIKQGTEDLILQSGTYWGDIEEGPSYSGLVTEVSDSYIEILYTRNKTPFLVKFDKLKGRAIDSMLPKLKIIIDNNRFREKTELEKSLQSLEETARQCVLVEKEYNELISSIDKIIEDLKPKIFKLEIRPLKHPVFEIGKIELKPILPLKDSIKSWDRFSNLGSKTKRIKLNENFKKG